MTDEDSEESFKTAYLVRLKPNQQDPREFVGVFVADGLAELIDLVDECCPVDACEYVVLPSGGLYQGGRASVVPYTSGEGEARFFNGAALCENWTDAFLMDKGEEGWRSLASGGAAND